MHTLEDLDESVIPEIRDRVIAARVASSMVAVAALWFFVSPWSYFGGADTASAWNSWIVGTVMFLLALGRSWYPIHTSGFSIANAILAVWILIAPWILGYSAHTGRLANSLCVGVFVLGMSIASIRTRNNETSAPLATYLDEAPNIR